MIDVVLRLQGVVHSN